MPAATSKRDLIAVTEAEFSRLSRLIGRVPAEIALLKDADDTSIKDVVAHRAHWIDLFLGWYAEGQAGRDVHFPAKGYKWSELKRYNADLRARQRALSWDEAVALLVDRYARLITFCEGLEDADLYGAAMQGARNDWTPGRWAEAAGASHFRSASKYIRARLREAS